MIRIKRFSNVFFILTSITLWLLIIYAMKTANASERYPYILPKCCEPNIHIFQARNSRSSDGRPIGSCGVEGSEVVLLPRQFFPAMSADFEDVKVELRNLEDGLKCDDGPDEVDILIDFEDLDYLKTVSIGKKKGFDEVAFSGDNLLATEGKIYSPRNFCVSSSTTNKTRVDIKTCKQECSSRRPCIPRCCGGHRSVLNFPPTSTSESFLEFCSTPSLEKNLWNPMKSKIVGREDNRTDFNQNRHSIPQGSCRLLYFNEGEDTPLTLLNDGRLQLNLENTTEVLESFCIDGIVGEEDGGSEETSGDDFSHPQEREVVVAYVCSSKEASPSTTLTYKDDEVLSLPVCNYNARHFDQLLQLPLSLFPEAANETRDVVLVRLTSGEKDVSLECAQGYEDFNVEFKDVEDKLFLEDGSLIFNRYILDRTQFCILSMFNNAMRLRTCKEECSVERPCINRCCSGNAHLILDDVLALPPGDQWKMECETPSSLPRENGTEWGPLFYGHVEDTYPFLYGDEDVQPLIRKRRPYAKDCDLSSPNQHEKAVYATPYKVMRTGNLMEKVKRKTWMKVNEHDYCMEPYMRRKQNGELELSGNPEDILIWRCWRNEDLEGLEESGYIDTRPWLMSTLHFTFSIFYLLVAVVYILRKDKEPVFRWSIVCCSISMTLTYCFFGYTRIGFLFHEQQTNNFHYFSTCAVIGMLANFVFLNGFSWITALCFDVWLTLTFLRPGKKSMKRLCIYVAFTLILPSAIVGTGVILDFIYFNDTFSDVLVPKYGEQRCLFEPQDAPLPYLYGPLAVLSSINILLFSATVTKLWTARHSSEISKSKNDSQRAHRKTFLLYFKLFLLMGVLWVLETVTWAFTELNKPVPVWAIVTEIVTLVQPAFVFFFLVWNGETSKYMGSKYPKLKGLIDFICGIVMGLRNKLDWCRCCKPAANVNFGIGTSSNGTNDTPVSSNYMPTQPRRLPDIPIRT